MPKVGEWEMTTHFHRLSAEKKPAAKLPPSQKDSPANGTSSNISRRMSKS
jgi:hypothetical protein